MVKHLKGKQFVKWSQKMSSDLKRQDNNKFCIFHNDYGHMTEHCKQLRWEIEALIKKKAFERVYEYRGLSQ